MPEPLPLDLAAALATTSERRGHIGDPAYYFTETSSTNDVAARYAEGDAREGTTVIAGAQTAGRGRLGREWYSPPGAGLYVSVIVRDERAAPFLTLAGGVAVATGIRAATGLPLEIKWPNDVVTKTSSGPAPRRKIAGILAEGSTSAEGLQYVILGMGINLNPAAYPPSLHDRASSIAVELGRAVDAGPVLAEILAALATELASLGRGDRTGLLTRWRTLAPFASGAAVECDGPRGRVSGVTAGIADDGALLVRVGDAIERVVAGEVVWK
jgi:BirA family biotin operon repressor/biotin-[acetyl-CoA-carboxylase] ligase